jgi:hypothetical protein
MPTEDGEDIKDRQHAEVDIHVSEERINEDVCSEALVKELKGLAQELASTQEERDKSRKGLYAIEHELSSLRLKKEQREQQRAKNLETERLKKLVDAKKREKTHLLKEVTALKRVYIELQLEAGLEPPKLNDCVDLEDDSDSSAAAAEQIAESHANIQPSNVNATPLTRKNRRQRSARRDLGLPRIAKPSLEELHSSLSRRALILRANQPDAPLSSPRTLRRARPSKRETVHAGLSKSDPDSKQQSRRVNSSISIGDAQATTSTNRRQSSINKPQSSTEISLGSSFRSHRTRGLLGGTANFESEIVGMDEPNRETRYNKPEGIVGVQPTPGRRQVPNSPRMSPCSPGRYRATQSAYTMTKSADPLDLQVLDLNALNQKASRPPMASVKYEEFGLNGTRHDKQKIFAALDDFSDDEDEASELAISNKQGGE